jgi:hypothetical protein
MLASGEVMKLGSLVLAATATALFGTPALAHHSFAMFDHAKLSKLSGTVKEFEWINPHAWVHMTVTDATGKTVTWSFEAGSVGQLTQAGWKRDSLKVGDRIEMGFHPLKDGSHGGQVLTVAVDNGTKLCQAHGCNADGGASGVPPGGRGGGGGAD